MGNLLGYRATMRQAGKEGQGTLQFVCFPEAGFLCQAEERAAPAFGGETFRS